VSGEIPAGIENVNLANPSQMAAKNHTFDIADLAVFGAVILAAAGHLMIKAGLVAAAPAASHALLLGRLLTYFSQPYVLLGLTIYGIGTALWILAVSKHDISYVFPISALNYVLVTLGGKFLFAESVSLKRWAGVALVILGVGLMQSGGRKGKP
jgi:drug/metabolite transporter (DMT)-like permease